MSQRYFKSEKMLKNAENCIPLGTQTFSKSKTQFPYGVSPYFIERGDGCKVWDVDGNKYIDFISSLAAVTLGYNDKDINNAVINQLQKGVTFSLAHPIEAILAKKIIEMVPSAEKVRFGKNGSDATAGAIRLARAYTKKDYILYCGYHGWQDWYIGATSMNKGVPEVVQKLTDSFIYNDIDSLRNKFSVYKDQVAAVIIEPMNVNYPTSNFLEKVKDLTHKNKALLIFDETITGFRLAKGGAQELFNVTPDITTLGKGLANGFPLSAIVGKSKFMKMIQEIFFSFTFGGETLSLAASLATLNKIQNQPVLETIEMNGKFLINEIKILIDKYSLEDYIDVSGHPSWSFLIFLPTLDIQKTKTFYMQEMMANGILCLGSHNLTYSHSKDDILHLLQKYELFFSKLKQAIKKNNLSEYIQCDLIKPLFKVR